MKYKKNLKIPAPIIILVRPQMAENIGMVARAMMNCGLSELRIVDPRDDFLSDKALSTSSGAQSILKEAQRYSTLEQAIADVHYVLATTARIRGINKQILHPKQAVSKIINRINKKQKVALLFGPERTGLENSDLIFADSLLQIPLNPVHPSLNLAQAVLLVGWVWWQENLKNEKISDDNFKLASKNELNLFINFLIQHLDNKKYFKIDSKKERMLQNLKNIFAKSLLSSAEIKTLYRIVKCLSGSFEK